MRAVLDVNILVAALLSAEGAPAELVARWLDGDFELVVSDTLLAELERTLAYPKLRSRIDADAGAAFTNLLRVTATLADDPAEAQRRSADPADDYLLALAETTEAIVVSGDRHLLDLANELPTLTARQFANALG